MTLNVCRRRAGDSVAIGSQSLLEMCQRVGDAAGRLPLAAHDCKIAIVVAFLRQ